ncbi:MAG: hypothetical protein JRF18_01140 [Deltaproteobacteria bacterium]|nr:hypothetical protein [Deltaproteobacteria bacterium]
MRLGTFYSSHQSNVTGVDDNDDLNIDLADISRFGARGQVGDIYGVVEMGMRGNENRAGYDTTFGGAVPYYNRQIYTRLLYGKWDFGAGNLIVGQDYTLPTYPSAQQAPGVFDLQNGFIGVGTLWDRRYPQVKVVLDNGLTFLAAQTFDGIGPSGGFAPPAGTLAGGNSDVIIPKLQVAWDVRREGWYIGPGIGYNTYKYDDTAVGGTFDDDIDSYVAFLKGSWDPGPVAFRFTVHYGENLSNFGILGRKNANAVVVNNSVQDAECWGGYLQAAFKVDPTTITVGWGYSSSDNDASGPEADELMGIFVNCKVPIAETFFIVPEFSWWDGMDNAMGIEDPDSWHLGILWQADF